MNPTQIKAQHNAVQRLEQQKKLKILKSGVDTNQAFETLLEDKTLWAKTGESIERLYYTRHLHKSKKYLSLSRIHDLLQKAGLTPTTTWTLK